MCAIVCHTPHGDRDLLSATEALGAILVKLDENKVVIHLEHLLEVIRLQLRSQFTSEKHRSLLRCIVHGEEAFHLAGLIDSL